MSSAQVHPAVTGGTSSPSQSTTSSLSSDSTTHSYQTSSIKSIDENNQSKQSPVFLVLDDINVDILTVLLSVTTVFAYFILGSTFIASSTAAAILLMRTFLPIEHKPEGNVLITGGSSGIGMELADIFAKNGHKKMIIVGRSDEKLDQVKQDLSQKYGTEVHTIELDLSVPGAAKKLYQQVKQTGIQVDVLCNNAGLGGAGDVMNQSTDLTEAIINLNCIALIELTQLFGKEMVQRKKGWILQTSSIVGWIVGPGQDVYHASKHLVRAFSEALSMELRGTGVVNTQLSPGPIHTKFGQRAHLEQTATFSYGYWAVMEDPGVVAQSGYYGLCKNKRMVFSTWNAAMTSLMFHLMPRSIHLTMARLMNTPTEYKEPKPEKYQ